MKNKIHSLLVFLALFSASNVNAIPIDIDSLFVDEATVSLSSSLGSATVSSPLPSVEITMGAYQDPIFYIGDSTLSLNIYSTADYFNPAPSGYVDDTSIFVDLSSLRASVTYNSYSFDVELWPITTALDYGIYNPVLGDYTIGWSEVISIDVSAYLPSYPATLDVSLSGYLTTVPVPAAVWLFGSGLIGLAGFLRRRQNA